MCPTSPTQTVILVHLTGHRVKQKVEEEEEGNTTETSFLLHTTCCSVPPSALYVLLLHCQHAFAEPLWVAVSSLGPDSVLESRLRLSPGAVTHSDPSKADGGTRGHIQTPPLHSRCAKRSCRRRCCLWRTCFGTLPGSRGGTRG